MSNANHKKNYNLPKPAWALAVIVLFTIAGQSIVVKENIKLSPFKSETLKAEWRFDGGQKLSEFSTGKVQALARMGEGYKINLAQAAKVELMCLAGIGEGYSKQIVLRRANYFDLESALRMLPVKTREQLKPWVSFNQNIDFNQKNE